MLQWKKVSNPEEILNQVGLAALQKFLAGEIFLINLGDQQTHKELQDFTLYTNARESTISPSDSKPAESHIVTRLRGSMWEKKPQPSYLLLTLYSDGSRGIFYSNMPFSPVQLDRKKISNCWEKRDGVSEAFCYDNDKQLLMEFIRLLDQHTSLDELTDEICAYFSLDSAELNPSTYKYA